MGVSKNSWFTCRRWRSAHDLALFDNAVAGKEDIMALFGNDREQDAMKALEELDQELQEAADRMDGDD